MAKIKTLKTIVFICIFQSLFSSDRSYALDVGSDTSLGSLSFQEFVTLDGEFTERGRWWRRRVDSDIRGVWSGDYSYLKTTTYDLNGNAIIDNTNTFDFSLGGKKKKAFEYGAGLTYSSTAEESLKDYGPNIYYGKTFLLSDASGDDAISFKLTLTEIAYVQTFGSTTTTRKGRVKPTTGANGITQFSPKFDLNFDLVDPLIIRLSYAYYFYNRNVPDFVGTLDNPRVAGLNSTVSGFSIEQTGETINWFSLDALEVDGDSTQATSALDGSLTWTLKAGFLYEFAKNWRAGASFEYEESALFTDHVYTISFKYEPAD